MSNKRIYLLSLAAALAALGPVDQAAATVSASIERSDTRQVASPSAPPLFDFVLAKGDEGTVIAAHRSHRSHASHRSHRSHYSSR